VARRQVDPLRNKALIGQTASDHRISKHAPLPFLYAVTNLAL
jgi:hypothetical protein